MEHGRTTTSEVSIYLEHIKKMVFVVFLNQTRLFRYRSRDLVGKNNAPHITLSSLCSVASGMAPGRSATSPIG